MDSTALCCTERSFGRRPFVAGAKSECECGDYWDDDGGRPWTPLHFAAQNGHLEVVRLLLERGANVNAQNTDELWWRERRTPLHFAAQNGHLDVVRLLLERGANVNAETSGVAGWTPLHFAAQNGHLEVVRVLLERGANVNAQTTLFWEDADARRTPLHYATKNGHLEVVRLLLERGANVNAQATVVTG